MCGVSSGSPSLCGYFFVAGCRFVCFFAVVQCGLRIAKDISHQTTATAQQFSAEGMGVADILNLSRVVHVAQVLRNFQFVLKIGRKLSFSLYLTCKYYILEEEYFPI